MDVGYLGHQIKPSSPLNSEDQLCPQTLGCRYKPKLNPTPVLLVKIDQRQSYDCAYRCSKDVV
jgi:hypothetical protein